MLFSFRILNFSPGFGVLELEFGVFDYATRVKLDLKAVTEQ